MQAKGKEAPPKPTGFTEMERTYIAIGIAIGILAIIVLLAVAVVSDKYGVFFFNSMVIGHSRNFGKTEH